MPKYRRIPIVIDASQFMPMKKPWPEGVYEYGGQYWIDTAEGTKVVKAGDWIIVNAEGNKEPCKPSVFRKTYELMERPNGQESG